MSEPPIKPEEPNVPPLELMAALSSLLVHDLANHVSVISGNTQFAQLVISDPERLDTALKAILQASEVASALLRKCGPLRRSLGNVFGRSEITDLARDLGPLAGFRPGWVLEAPPQPDGYIVLGSHWVVLLSREIIAETRADHGAMSLARVAYPKNSSRSKSLPPGTSTEHLLNLTLAYVADQPFPFAEIRSQYANLLLAAAYELLTNAGGSLDCVTSEPTRQQVILGIPLAATS
ncbi:MAG TPA: hypothetical protein VJW76_14640 [Verrucomicrobiae bacterium]|nr:hypothetical protein [Verrucomicrobiae bacterium]